MTDTGSGRNAEAIQATRGKERASNGGDDKIISDVVSNAGIKFFWVITYTEITSTIKFTASFLCTQLLFVLHLLLGIVYCLLPR